jgi:Tfp pilus assembly protein PilX
MRHGPDDQQGSALARLSEQRGVALPMAMLALLIVSALIAALSVLAASEPTIAKNQLMVAQARAIAEAGVERAIWALNHAAGAHGIPATFTSAPAPYDGSRLVTVVANGHPVGGFRVTVTNGATAYERNIAAVGWVPNDTETSARQKITVTALNPRLVFKDPPAALSVRGELQMGGNSVVDSRSDQSCGRKVGTLTLGDTGVQDDGPDIRGAADGDDTRNEVTDANGGAVPAGAHDIVKNAARSVFDLFMLTDADVSALRAYAKARGTYYQGSTTFASGNLPNGLVFVDTVSGNNITQEGVTPATPSSDFASVDIHGNAPADPSGVFSGWVFVNGTLSIRGNLRMKGLAYAQNDIVYHGSAGGISGAMISRHIRDTSPTSIDPDLNGDVAIVYDCTDAKTGGGQIPNTWWIKGGSYKEVSGS